VGNGHWHWHWCGHGDLVELAVAGAGAPEVGEGHTLIFLGMGNGCSENGSVVALESRCQVWWRAL
jgi:hypothetical protein